MAFNYETVLFTFAVLTAGIKSCCQAWNYDGSHDDLGPNTWYLNYSACAGFNQSPIDINVNTTSKTNAVLTFGGYNTTSTSQNYSILNNGHTIRVNVNVKTISLKSSLLNGTYILEQFHFHWGIYDNIGSEHSINGQFFPLELHMVHYNSDKYDNVSQAASSNDSSAILVLGVFCVAAPPGRESSTALETLVNYIGRVPYLNNRTVIAAFPMERLLPCEASTMYSYSGSLTAPPCAEDVNWNVFAQPIYMSNSTLTQLLDEFRKVHGDNPADELTTNNRPTQPINNRTVYEYNIPSPCVAAPLIASTASPYSITTASANVTDRSGGGAESLHSCKMLTALLLNLVVIVHLI